MNDAMPSLIEAEWNPPHGPLPTQKDFNAHVDDPDACWAWKTFGELTRPQAYALFLENAHSYQEDFMWMGSAAFAYYYPVIERYLLEYAPQHEGDYCPAAIIAACIQMQFVVTTAARVQHLRPRILALAAYVRSHLEKWESEVHGRRSIDRAWLDLEKLLAGQKA